MFVLTDFKSPDYDYLYKNDNRIVGPPVVLHCAAREEVRGSQPLRRLPASHSSVSLGAHSAVGLLLARKFSKRLEMR